MYDVFRKNSQVQFLKSELLKCCTNNFVTRLPSQALT